jgi:serine/threonine protein kinase
MSPLPPRIPIGCWGEQQARPRTKRVEKLQKKFSEMYVVETVIHDGGAPCCVKRVRSLEHGTLYVVKVQRKQFIRDEAIFRRRTELIMNSPDSAYVIKVFACYEDENNYYTILESLYGGDVFDFASAVLHSSEGENVAPDVFEETVRNIMNELLRSLRHLHAQGIIHRDVKLENLVLTTSEGSSSEGMKGGGRTDTQKQDFVGRFADLLAMCSGSSSSILCSGTGSPKSGTGSPKAVKSRAIKLIDFDFLEEYQLTCPQSEKDSFACEGTLRTTQRIVGTDGYIAPEAYLGSACPKSDVFSAGVAMFALMTGRYPHNASIFDDVPEDNFVGSPKMSEIHGKLRNYKVSFGREWDPFPEAKSLCERMLEPDVDKRLDAMQALRHPWFLGSMTQGTIIVPLAAPSA